MCSLLYLTFLSYSNKKCLDYNSVQNPSPLTECQSLEHDLCQDFQDPPHKGPGLGWTGAWDVRRTRTELPPSVLPLFCPSNSTDFGKLSASSSIACTGSGAVPRPQGGGWTAASKKRLFDSLPGSLTLTAHCSEIHLRPRLGGLNTQCAWD